MNPNKYIYYKLTPLFDLVSIINIPINPLRQSTHNLSPDGEKLNEHTPYVSPSLNTQSGWSVLLSHTYTFGFGPISPVATLIPSGWRSIEIISSLWYVKNL